MKCPYCGAETNPPRCKKCKAAVSEPAKKPKGKPEKEKEEHHGT